MASSNAHRVLEKSLRSDPARARAVRVQGTELLEMINERAMNHAHALSQKKQTAHLHQEHHVDKMLQGMSPEDAREFAFQAREQIAFLDGVHTRVERVMEKTKDLFAPEEAKSNQSDPKIWVEESRRLLNRKMFLYNESCEERQKELSSFCDWFDVYQNIWPLPLVGSEAQYSSFLGNPAKELDWTEENKMQEMWPKISKMKDDLSHIMSVTSEMGQKALGLEVRKEMKRLNIVIRDCQTQIEEGKKKLEHEKKTVLAKEADLVKHRHMHETALNSRNEVIKMLTEEKNKLIESAQLAAKQHRQEMEELHASYQGSILQYQAEIKDLKRDHEIQRKEIAKSFEAKIKEGEDAISALKVRVLDLQLSVQNVQLELKSKNEEITFLTNRFAEANASIEKMTGEITRLQNELRAEKANPYVKQVEKERDELASRGSVLKAQVEKLEGTLAVMKKTSDSATLLVGLRDEEIRNLKISLQESTLEIQKITGQYEAMCAASERQRCEISNHLKEILAKREFITSLEDELKAAYAKCAKSAEEAAFLGAMAENLRGELDEETTKNSKLLSYVTTLQTEKAQDRERFKTEIDELTTKNASALAILEAEVKDLREYKASRLTVRFSQMETQTTELLESQDTDELSEFEAAASRRIAKRLSGLKEKVNSIRIMFEREVATLKENVRNAINFREPSGSALDGTEAQGEIKDLNKFVELSVTTLSELEHVLEGVDEYLCSPFDPDGTTGDTTASLNSTKQGHSNLLLPTLKKMDLHVVENNFDFSRIHKLQPLPLSSNDIRVVNKNLQTELQVPIETALLHRNNSLVNVDPRQFYANYASPMKQPENLMGLQQPSRQSAISSLLGGNADLVPFSVVSPNEIKDVSGLPSPELNVSFNGLAPSNNISLAHLGTTLVANVSNIPQAGTHQSILTASESFRSSFSRKDRVQRNSSSALIKNPNVIDQRQDTPVGPSSISTGGLVRMGSERKDFEVLEASNVFSRSEIFGEDAVSGQYSPVSSKDRASAASGMRAATLSRLSNISTRPNSRAQDLVFKSSPASRGADIFPMPLSRSNSGADMLTTYTYLSNVSPWDGYSETKNDSASTVTDVKGPYHEVASSESCFQGFKPSKMLKVLQPVESDPGNRSADSSLQRGSVTMEVLNVLHPSSALPILQPTNKSTKSDVVKKKNDLPSSIQPGQGTGPPGSGNAWLNVQGVQRPSKKLLFVSNS